MTLSVLVAAIGIGAVLAGTPATLVVAIILVCAGEWSDRARVNP